MAYDLLLRKQTPNIFSRDSGTAVNLAGGVGILTALGILLLPRLRRMHERQREIAWYRKRFDPSLGRTQEVPVISMEDIVRAHLK